MIKQLKIITAISALFLLNGCHTNLFEELDCIYPSHFTEQEKIAITVLDAYLKKGKREDIIFIGLSNKEGKINQHIGFIYFLQRLLKTEIQDATNAYFLPKEYIKSVKMMRYVI
jgi:hypothetical protein